MAHKYENKQAALLAKVKGKTGKISDKTHEEHLKLYTGYVNKSNALLEAIEELGTPDPDRRQGRQPDLVEDPRHQGRPDLRAGRPEEPRALLQHPRRRRKDQRQVRRAGRSRFRLLRELQEGPEGHRHRRARLGLDRHRSRDRQAAQLHRRRAEHLPDLGRHAGARPRRLRARLLRRLLHGPRRLYRRIPEFRRLQRGQRAAAEVVNRIARHRVKRKAPGLFPRGFFVAAAVVTRPAAMEGHALTGAATTSPRRARPAFSPHRPDDAAGLTEPELRRQAASR